MNPTLRDYLFLHFLVIILGFTAILGKLIEINPVAIVLFRTAIASVVIAGILILRGLSFKVSKPLLRRLIFAGVILAFHWVCFFGSARLATVSISLITYSTASFFTSIIEPLGTKKKISGREVLLGSFAVIGILLIFNFETQYFAGIMVGLFGAFLVAIYSTSNAVMTHKLPSNLINFYQLSAACLGMILSFPIFWKLDWLDISSSIPTQRDWFWLVALATVFTVFPYIAMVTLMRKFSAFTINLSLNMEPIYGVALALFFFGETEYMSNGFYFGSILILTSVLLHAYWDRQKKAPKAKPKELI